MTSPLDRLTGAGKPLAAEPPDAKEFEGVPGKYEKYFSPDPGTGD